MISPSPTHLILSIILFISGCVGPPVTMNHEFSPVNKVEQHVITECKVYYLEVADHRRDKTSLGSVAYREVFSEDPVQWVKNALLQYGFIEKPKILVNNQEENIKISLKVAHINSVLTTKAANIVIGLSYNDFSTVEYFRGSHASMNWSSSSNEIKAAFDIALELAIKDLRLNLTDHCK